MKTRIFTFASGLLLWLAGLAYGTDNSVFVSQSVPSPMVPGQVYAVSVTMQNTGTTTWSAANLFRLGSSNALDNTLWGMNRVMMPAADSVAPGATYTFNFNVTAPTTAGIYNFQWRTVHDGVAYFGATTPNMAVAAGQVNHSAFVSQTTVPTSMVANQIYPVSITLQNIGGTTWVPGTYSLQAQDTAWSPSRVELAGPVAPGESATFAINVKPLVTGVRSFLWRMAQGTTVFGATNTSVSVSVSGTDNSVFVSQSVPSPMVPGQVYAVSVTMQNTGTTTWSEANLFRLGYALTGQNWGIASARVLIPAADSVAPGATYTFNFNVTAPTTAGIYNFQWRTVHDGVVWFGPLTPNVAVAVNGVNDAQLVSQFVPATMVPGLGYTALVTLKNTGNTTWSPGAYYLGSMNAQDNTTWGLNRAELVLPVAVGESVILDFHVTAPTSAGTYNFQWQMTQRGTRFGPLTTNVPVSVSSAGNAAYVSQSVPSSMVPGQTYAVSVTMQNTGGSTWSPGTYYLGSMNAQDNTTWGLSRVDLASPVAAGASVALNFNVTAPTTAGSYNFQWQMTQGGARFGALTANVPVNVTTETTAAQLYFIHVDHLNTPRMIADSTGTTVWRWDQGEPFGNDVPNNNPSGAGAFDFPLRFPGQYFDRETNLAYNYFRDYDPATGRYVQSDPIGLMGGVNTYTYVRAHTLWAVDVYGLAEICRRITEQEWKAIGRGWKIVDWKCEGPCNPISDAIFTAVSMLLPAWYIPTKIPVVRDLQLEQAYNVDYKICYDECTKKQTSKTKLGEEPLKEYRENWFNPTTEHDGEPTWVQPGQENPSMQTRWGAQYR